MRTISAALACLGLLAFPLRAANAGSASANAEPPPPAVSVQPDPRNVLSTRLEGRWQVAVGLNEELGNKTAQSPVLLTFRADPAIARGLSPQIAGLFAAKRIYLAGTVAVDRLERNFLVAESFGASHLFVFKLAAGDPKKVTDLYVTLAPAWDKKSDLLFVGGDDLSQPFIAYERRTQAGERELEEGTRSLVRELTGHTSMTDDKFHRLEDELGRRKDWQRAVTILTEEIGDDPSGEQNNRCLALESLIRAHLADIQLDVDPLIVALGSKVVTNQQKAALALASATKRPDLFAGKEQKATRALIPLVTSQRGRVVEAALAALGGLTGKKEIGRDPAAWAALYEERYHEPLALKGAVYELLAFVHLVPQKGSGTLFVLGEDPHTKGRTLAAPALKAELLGFEERARQIGLVPRVVIVTAADPLLGDPDAVTRLVGGTLDVLREVGISNYTTVAPETDTFYPPYRPAFP